MAKIDLYDPKWVEMVFADKNKTYGAYNLRKTVSQRNIKALAILLIAAKSSLCFFICHAK